jgi:GDP-L-fucose synthase
MRILVTGGHGMVGRNLRAHPKARAHELLAPTRTELDLRDRSRVLAFLRESRPDLVVHAAGRVGGIQANIENPYAFLLENLEMGTNMVSCAIEAGVPRLLNLASSCIYPRDHDGRLTEDLILAGRLEPTNEGYALAKIAALRLCEYAAAAGHRCKTVIPCNLYGPYDDFDLRTAHLVPAAIHKVHLARQSGAATVEIWGDGSARREFMYAGDLADALLAVAAGFDDAPALMNIGPGEDHTVLAYYQAVAAVVGWRGEFTFDRSRPVGMRRKLLDVSRQNSFGWHPACSLEDGLRATYEHFRSRGAA